LLRIHRSLQQDSQDGIGVESDRGEEFVETVGGQIDLGQLHWSLALIALCRKSVGIGRRLLRRGILRRGVCELLLNHGCGCGSLGIAPLQIGHAA
jgi:hypothetical protein